MIPADAVPTLTPEVINALGNQLMRFGYAGLGLLAWYIFWKNNPWKKSS